MTCYPLRAATAAAFFLAIIPAVATAPNAFAQGPVTAALAQPLGARTTVIAGGALFICEADACRASASTSRTFTLAACKALADKVGPLTAFSGERPMGAEALASCNAAALARAGEGRELAGR